MATTTPFNDGQNGAEIRERLNSMWSDWRAALETAVGKDGWSPLLRVVADGQRQVIQLYDWIGGTTAKPATGYMGASGLVATAAEAVNFKGGQGDKGDDGGPGPANNLAGVDVSTGDPGTDATASVTGTYPAQRLVLQIPRGNAGQPGPTPNLTPGTIETGAPGTDVVITITGTAENPILNVRIPQGQPGTGSGDVVGPAGVDDLQLAQFDGLTGKLISALGLTGILGVDGGRPYVAEAGIAYATPLQLEGKVDKAAGKVLSSNDFTNSERVKLTNIAVQATKNAADSYLLDRQNHTGAQAIGTVTGLSGALAAKQETLVSGTNIKTINGQDVTGSGNLTIEAGAEVVRTPVNSAPVDGASDVNETVTLVGSPFMSLYGVTMGSSRWQVSVDPAFGALIVDATVSGTSTSYRIPPGQLVESTAYYWRLSYQSPEGDVSKWSSATPFTTAAAFNDYIDTPTPTPAAFGDPLEGGFYAGMVWHDIAASTTSVTVGTGLKVFQVPDMNLNPIAYPGQVVEVRNNLGTVVFRGTVADAVGTNLSVNVNSVQGSGTAADWYVMARHRIIVAPKATGENPSLYLKSTTTALPAGSRTQANGWRSTEAMVAADSATVYAAAHWCRSLVINGRNDWYLPARDELELLWRNLKPVTGQQYSDFARNSSSYVAGFGENPGSGTQGNNSNSWPAGANYTLTLPAQTAALAFRTGGAEALPAGNIQLWSSSQGNTATSADAWYQAMGTGVPGAQFYQGPANSKIVRAVRRSII